MTTRSRALLFTVACAGFVSPAAAGERDPVKADALFREAIELLKKDAWQTACPKFQESLALDPSVGAAINIARCDERSGKTFTAWQSFQKARELNRGPLGEVLSPQSDQFIGDAIARLEPLVPKIVVMVPKPAPGMAISLNGAAFSSLGKELQVDPGRAQFVVTAAGHRRLEMTVDAVEGKTTRVTLELEPEVPIAEKLGGPRLPPPPESEGGGFGPQAIAGFAIGGLGAASLIASAITGGIALSESSSMDESCTALPGCSGQTYQDAVAAYDRSQALALGSTISMFVGVALVGTGFVMVLTEPSNTPSNELTLVPAVAPGFAGVFFSGRL